MGDLKPVEYAAQDEQNIADFLRKEVERQGKTYKQISIESGVAQSQIQRFLAGRGGVSYYNFCKIARILGYKGDICPVNDDPTYDSIEFEEEKPKIALYGDKKSENVQEYDLAIEKAYEDLANAVIETACDDYRRLKKNNREKELIHHRRVCIAEIEAFFRSEYFGKFTSLDGNWLLNRLKKEV